MTAEIITIGTEILLGDIVDTNSRLIARRLRDLGIDLFRTTSVGDNPARIAESLREAIGRAAVVITTGGLGPTVDDPTRDAAAQALGLAAVFHEDLWLEIQERFARFGRRATENNRRQAYLPDGARPIHNPVGTAPGFYLEAGASLLIALPGVPAELEWLLDHEVMPYLGERFGQSMALHTRVVHVAGVGESWVDERIQDLEQLAHPTVGVLAHPGRIDIRIAAKAASPQEARAAIEPVETELRRRLGPAVYGADADSLEAVTLAAFAGRGWRLATVEAGTNGTLAATLAPAGPGWAGGLVLAEVEADVPDEIGLRWMQDARADALLALGMTQSTRSAEIAVRLLTPRAKENWTRKYGGALVNAPGWATAIALDLVRRQLGGEGA
jgi:competence/damage-inducible protein CinA-like protein